jgi:hypothetical protein
LGITPLFTSANIEICRKRALLVYSGISNPLYLAQDLLPESRIFHFRDRDIVGH